MDRISPAARSRVMAAVKSKDTSPERVVRKLLWSLGFRYRLHDRKLPGAPDLVFSSRKKVIFVNGCFWHCHSRCSNFRAPKSRVDFWNSKLRRNKLRDRKNVRALRLLGWEVLTVWECKTADLSQLKSEIVSFLGMPGVPGNAGRSVPTLVQQTAQTARNRR